MELVPGISSRIGLKDQHGHWVCWMSTGRKSGLTPLRCHGGSDEHSSDFGVVNGLQAPPRAQKQGKDHAAPPCRA